MLIAMCIWNTPENKKYDYTARTLDSVHDTVNLAAHRVFLVDNASTDPRTSTLLDGATWATVLRNESNVGTARAINRAWKERVAGESCVKMDDDVLIHQRNWPDLMEEVFRRDPTIGICALKRNDLAECPDNPIPHYRTTLHMLPHKPGERWIVVEKVQLAMGTCQGYNSALLDKIGGLWQHGLYGFDDSFAAVRCRVAGFSSVFIPYIPIDHIDPGDTPYQKWKEAEAWKYLPEFSKIAAEYESGERPIYWQDPE